MDCSQRLLCPWNFPGKNRSGLPFPFPGDLPDSGIEPTAAVSWQWQADSLPLSHGGKPALARIRNNKSDHRGYAVTETLGKDIQ